MPIIVIDPLDQPPAKGESWIPKKNPEVDAEWIRNYPYSDEIFLHLTVLVPEGYQVVPIKSQTLINPTPYPFKNEAEVKLYAVSKEKLAKCKENPRAPGCRILNGF
jgi:hypothetical protein